MANNVCTVVEGNEAWSEITHKCYVRYIYEWFRARQHSPQPFMHIADRRRVEMEKSSKGEQERKCLCVCEREKETCG